MSLAYFRWEWPRKEIELPGGTTCNLAIEISPARERDRDREKGALTWSVGGDHSVETVCFWKSPLFWCTWNAAEFQCSLWSNYWLKRFHVLHQSPSWVFCHVVAKKMDSKFWFMERKLDKQLNFLNISHAFSSTSKFSLSPHTYITTPDSSETLRMPSTPQEKF